MSFFNNQHYLGTTQEMQIKEDARLFASASSPERKRLLRLAGIPEATPGPNVFAQQEESMERHRLNGNAFYQQEVQRRIASPPSLAHPALRQRSYSDPPTPPRDSTCTTMSPFINAGPENSPPLKLVPSNAHLADPTTRGYIEERREQHWHDLSGSEEDRTPVFESPAIFTNISQSPKRRSGKQKEVTIIDAPATEIPAKTPKRSILEKLRLNTSFRSSTTAPPVASPTEPVNADGYDMPVKAKAVLGSPPKKKGRASLGSSPSKNSLPRSPSKRKGLFTRKPSGLLETTNRSKSAQSSRSAELEHPPLTASTVGKTPPTAFSDPSHNSFLYKTGRQISQPQLANSNFKSPDPKASAIARSQSLKYFDHGMPPTPLPKDTPPEEKAKREAERAQKAVRPPFNSVHVTPSKSTMGLVRTNGHLDVARFGNYGHHGAPTLVTRPSMYSLHASVVPGGMDELTFEDIKARVDGLGLEGFSMPPENTCKSKLAGTYSPSIYSTAWTPRPNGVFEAATPPPPHPIQHSKNSSDKSKGSSSNGEIAVCYPELAKDPSYSDITANTSKEQRVRVQDHLEVLPWHGKTHSRDHSSHSRHSRDSSIFAQHVDDDLLVNEPKCDSPTSFTHPSATPSPLQTLPATLYVLPPKKSKKRNELLTPAHARDRRSMDRKNNIVGSSQLSSPTRAQDRTTPFTNTPTLLPTVQLPGQPPNSPLAPTPMARPDPAKSTPSPPKPAAAIPKTTADQSTATEKLDQMLTLLQHLEHRNTEISHFHQEMRESNQRLGERLRVVEGLQRASPSLSSSVSEGRGSQGDVEENVEALGEVGETEKERGKRVCTQAAYDFYRAGPGGVLVGTPRLPSASASTSASALAGDGKAQGEQEEVVLVKEEEEEEEELETERADSGRGHEDGERKAQDTIAELRATNEKLLAMVQGFAERIRLLEEGGKGPGQ